MTFDLSVIERALASLNRAVERSTGAPADEELRDAVIQRFEYTMDLAWKAMHRDLKNAGVSDAAFRTKRDLFREAGAAGLIGDPELWFGFLEARNATSHIYNAAVAVRVYRQALAFAGEMESLLSELRRRHAGS